MAVIQFRSGAYADYDPAKMQAAEPAVVLSGDPDTEDGKSVRVAFGSGTDKRLLTEDDAFQVDDELSSLSENPVQNKVINTALNAKAPKASPTFTGTPTAPTASASTNNTQIATTKFVHDVADTKTKIWYGTCSTAAATAEKAVTVEETGFSLAEGVLLIVKFSTANTASSIKLNVNATGAKSVYAYGTTVTIPRYGSHMPCLFRYNGTSWDVVGDIPLRSPGKGLYASTISSVAGKFYAVKPDSDGYLSVCVPWTDTHGSPQSTDLGDGVVLITIT